MRRCVLPIAVLLVAAAACAPDLRDDYPFDGQTVAGPLVSTEALDGGVTLMHVDATNKSSEVYVDLDTGTELKADEAFATNAWDLAFMRYEISMNGGAGNPTGKVKAQVLQGQNFDALTQAPATGYVQDGSEAVLGGWWSYDILKHQVLTKEGLMYVVLSSEGNYFKLKMLSYYDSAGTPAAISLEYAPLTPP